MLCMVRSSRNAEYEVASLRVRDLERLHAAIPSALSGTIQGGVVDEVGRGLPGLLPAAWGRRVRHATGARSAGVSSEDMVRPSDHFAHKR
jgi:hypothetical protein